MIHRKAVPGFAGLSIGFIVFAIIVVVGPTSGGAIDPARCVAPSLLEAVFGNSGAVDWAQLPVHPVAEFVGAIVAARCSPIISPHPRRPGLARAPSTPTPRPAEV